MSFKENIEKAEPSHSFIWDGCEDQSVKGLHVRKYESGVISFFVHYRTRSGTQRRPKIGEFPAISVTEARYRAKKLLAQVVLGEDPKGDWDESKKEPTVGDVYAEALKKHWDKKQFAASGWAKEVERIYEKQIKNIFGSCKLSELKARRVRAWHAGFADTKPVAGNHALAVLGRIYSFAMEQEICVSNPCTLVKRHVITARRRYASPDELKKILGILRRELPKNPKGALFLLTVLYTGARPTSIERSKWEDIAFKDGYGVLEFKGKSTAKTGEAETILIPPQLYSIYSEAKTDPFGSKLPRHLWKKIQKEVGCEDLWARDLRRTFATLAMGSGVNVGVIGELLNHRDTQTTAVYAKLMDGHRVSAIDAVAKVVDSLTPDEHGSEQLTLDRFDSHP